MQKQKLSSPFKSTSSEGKLRSSNKLVACRQLALAIFNLDIATFCQVVPELRTRKETRVSELTGTMPTLKEDFHEFKNPDSYPYSSKPS